MSAHVHTSVSPGGDRYRAEYLDALAVILWPESESRIESRSAERRAGLDREYLVIPNMRSPRLLVPLQHRRSGASAVRHATEPRSLRGRLRVTAVSLAVRSGVSGALFRDRVRIARPEGALDVAVPTGDIEDYLRAAMGDVVLSVHIGPARANRKPVLQVLDKRGRTLGFVKIGVNDLTRRLVRAEANALSRLATAPLSTVVAPRVLHHSTWRSHEVLVQSALPVWRPRRRPSPERITQAMREVAEIGNVDRAQLGDSAFTARLSARIDALPTDRPGSDLRRLWADVLARAADESLSFGGCHGDWAPWNMAHLAEHLLVWDWERFSPNVPIGFDAVHYRLQRSVVWDGVSPAEALERCLSTAPSGLRGFGHEPSIAVLVALLYLLDLAVRYATDSCTKEAAELGVLDQWLDEWLLPAVTKGVERL